MADYSHTSATDLANKLQGPMFKANSLSKLELRSSLENRKSSAALMWKATSLLKRCEVPDNHEDPGWPANRRSMDRSAKLRRESGWSRSPSYHWTGSTTYRAVLLALRDHGFCLLARRDVMDMPGRPCAASRMAVGKSEAVGLAPTQTGKSTPGPAAGLKRLFISGPYSARFG